MSVVEDVESLAGEAIGKVRRLQSVASSNEVRTAYAKEIGLLQQELVRFNVNAENQRVAIVGYSQFWLKIAEGKAG